MRATRQQELMHGDAQPLEGRSLYPWAVIVTTVTASVTCAVLWWAVREVLTGPVLNP